MRAESRLTGLYVASFKSIGRERQGIRIRPLTILAGANSSGKSTLMQPLLLIKQTLESPFDPGPLLLNGPCVRVSEATQVLSRVPGANRTGFEFGFEVHGEQSGWAGLRFRYVQSKGLEVLANTLLEPDGNESLVEADDADHPAERLVYFFLVEPKTTASRLKFIGRSVVPSFWEPALRVIHVPGIRGNPERRYSSTAVGDSFPGTFEPYTASVIDRWQQDDDKARLDVLHRWLAALGLTHHVEARRLDDVSLEIRVARLPKPVGRSKPDMVSIADVGFGVSQVLPALVALLAAQEHGLVYIEQPELHLHPNAQVRLARVLAEAAQRGPSIVVETHSALLLREIQTMVAMGELDPKIVSLNWCNRDPKTGATTVTMAELDADGAYGDWPIDFDDVALDSERRYLDAPGSRRVG